MQKIIYLFSLVILAFSFSSCGGDDESNGSSDDVVGVWKIESYDYSGTSTTTTGGETFTSTFTGQAKDFETWELDFRESGNYISGGDMTITLTSSFAGQEFQFDQPFSDWLGTGSYEVDGDKISFTTDGETSECTIVEMSNSTLQMMCPITTSSMQQGVISTTTLDADVTLKK